MTSSCAPKVLQEKTAFLGFLSRIATVLLYFSIFLVLLYAYHSIISPLYGYLGFHGSTSKIKFLEALTLLIFVSCFLPTKFAKPSDLFLHIHFIFPIIPMLVLFVEMDLSRAFIYTAFLGFVLLLALPNWLSLRSTRIFSLSYKSLNFILIGLSLLVIFSIIAMGGLSYLNFDMTKVYEYRGEVGENLPAIYGYFTPMVIKVLVPFALVVSVMRKKWLLAFISIACSIMMFGLTGHKTAFFYPWFILFMQYLFKQKGILIRLPLSCLGFLVFLQALYVCVISSGGFSEYLIGLLIRRVFFIPALLNYKFFELFSHFKHVFWSDSKFGFGLKDYPYNLKPAELVGQYNSAIGLHTNTGWIGSGFMQAGLFGILLYAVIIGFLLVAINAIASSRGKVVVTAVTLVPFFSLFNSADLPPIFLTHGMALAMVLLSFLPREDVKIKK